MSLNSGERQVAPSIDGIRADHVARYQWVIDSLDGPRSIKDLGCGIGYGSNLLASSGHTVIGIDIDSETLDYARQHYEGPRYFQHELGSEHALRGFSASDVAVAFEVIEHLQDPRHMLRNVTANTLFASVPDEAHFPHGGNIAFHHRHYTREQFEALLAECGWHVQEIKYQDGPHSPVGDKPGRTIVAKANRFPTAMANPSDDAAKSDPLGIAGKHIGIVAMGPSAEAFFVLAKVSGGVNAICDEVWGINAVGNTLKCDRIIHMDDVRVQMARAEKRPNSNIAQMMQWMQQHPGPIYTSHCEPGWPGLVRFPLEEVVREMNEPYFNGTAAYALALAIYGKAARISVFGCDYTQENGHYAERGRACLEYWMGVGAARGIKFSLPMATSLMDAAYLKRQGVNGRLYGYDGYDIAIDEATKAVTYTPRRLPTVEEIEARYDHSKPPSQAAMEAGQ